MGMIQAVDHVVEHFTCDDASHVGPDASRSRRAGRCQGALNHYTLSLTEVKYIRLRHPPTSTCFFQH